MRILVTGSTGVVGRRLIPVLCERVSENDQIALLIRDQEKSRNLFNQDYRLNHIESTSIDYKHRIKVFDPHVVLHLASHLSSRDDEETIEELLKSNIEFGTHVLDALAGTNIRYFINVGTFSEYLYNDGELVSAYLYSATKTAYRSIVRYYQSKLGFRWINVIPYSIYGGGDTQKKVLDYIIDSLNATDGVAMSNGEQRLDFVHVDDVVDFFCTLLCQVEHISNEYIEFHLGTGVGTSIKEVAQLVEQTFNGQTNLVWGKLPYRQRDIMQAIAHTVKGKEALKWEAKIDVKSGLKIVKEEMEKLAPMV